NNTLEAHSDFAPMSSEGCIACHTTYNTIVNYSRPEFIEYNITELPDGEWTVSNFNTIGVLNITGNSERKGGDHKWMNVSCNDCHQDIFNAAGVGGHAVVLYSNGTQVKQHSNANITMEAWCRTCHNRNDTMFGSQHAARKTSCDECHEAYGQSHPGNFFSNIKTVPRLYRSLVCIACKSTGWQKPAPAIHFRVREEPYFDVVVSK
ncbi:MAG TPA: cytochrome c3 family protein, partial [Candidatus Methanoperedens sp.]